MATKSKPSSEILRRGEPASYLRRPAAAAMADLAEITERLEANTVMAKVLLGNLDEMAADLAVIRDELTGLQEVLAEAERREAGR